LNQTVVPQVTNGSWTGGSAATVQLDLSFNSTKNTITTVTALASTAPSLTGYNSTALAARAIIESNKSAISTNVTNYLTSTYQGGFSYNQTTCYRDVGYIVDAMAIDLLTGGTYQSINAGKAYYRNSSALAVAIGTQRTETLDALTFIQTLANEVMNQVTGTRYQILTPQVFDGGLTASTNAINTFNVTVLVSTLSRSATVVTQQLIKD
jgi:hypothetical protein